MLHMGTMCGCNYVYLWPMTPNVPLFLEDEVLHNADNRTSVGVGYASLAYVYGKPSKQLII